MGFLARTNAVVLQQQVHLLKRALMCELVLVLLQL
jgi:hypothetical protein